MLTCSRSTSSSVRRGWNPDAAISRAPPNNAPNRTSCPPMVQYGIGVIQTSCLVARNSFIPYRPRSRSDVRNRSTPLCSEKNASRNRWSAMVDPMRLRWLWRTALGAVVVPDVRKTMAVSDGCTAVSMPSAKGRSTSLEPSGRAPSGGTATTCTPASAKHVANDDAMLRSWTLAVGRRVWTSCAISDGWNRGSSGTHSAPVARMPNRACA
jgi:hypothetical protein